MSSSISNQLKTCVRVQDVNTGVSKLWVPVEGRAELLSDELL